MTAGALSPDADLVAGVLAGDRQAFAGVYERYADRLHDFAYSMLRNREEAADCVADSFVVMAEKVGQLRDRSRLRPWLYSVVRNECLRTLRGRAREAHDDEWLDAMPDPTTGPEDQVADAAVAEELRELVWAAVEGLNDRDRALLDLHLRQGLEGAELAAAMDVTPASSYVMLSRARDQVERALGALLIARRGSEECTDLADLLRDWDGTFSPLIRKRVARHIDGCETCESRRRLMLSPLALLAGVPAFAAPAALRDRVLDDERLVAFYADVPVIGGAGRVGGRRRGLLAAAAVLLLVLGVIVAAVLWPDGGDAEEAADPLTSTATPSDPSDPSPTATATASPTRPGGPSSIAAPSSAPTTEATTDATLAAPGDLRASTRSIDLGTAGTTSTVRLTNRGGSPVDFTARSRTGWLSVSTASGSIGPDGSTRLRIAADRSGLADGRHTGQVAVTWSGGTIVVTVSLTVDRPPTVGRISSADAGCTGSGRSLRITAAASDGTGVSSVRIAWNGPGGADGERAATRSEASWTATIGPFPVGGDVAVTVTARDTAGHTSTGRRTFSFDPCPG